MSTETPGWEFQPDGRDSVSTLPPAPTPGAPATTQVVAYVDRENGVWLTWYKPNGEVYLIEAATSEDLSWLLIATVETHLGPLVPLVREDTVAAREAEAERRGAEKMLRDTVTWLNQYGVESEITDHLLATLFALGADDLAGGS